jgi:tetratricopeptide (TPR) repeat protein
MMLDEYDQAKEQFLLSIQVQPNYGASSNLGTLAFNQGQIGEAVQWFEQAIDTDNPPYVAWGNLAAAYQALPDRQRDALEAYARAAEQAEKVREVAPRDGLVISDLAVYYSELGQREQAGSLIKEALEISPGDLFVQMNAVSVYRALGDLESAMSSLEKAVDAGYPFSMIDSDPGLEALREHQRYQQLRDRLGAASKGEN